MSVLKLHESPYELNILEWDKKPQTIKQTNKQIKYLGQRAQVNFYSIVLFYLIQYWKSTIQYSRQFNSFYVYKKNSKNQTDQTQPLHGWNIADTA